MNKICPNVNFSLSENGPRLCMVLMLREEHMALCPVFVILLELSDELKTKS